MVGWEATKPNKAKTPKEFWINSLCENREKQTHAGHLLLNQAVTAILILFLAKFVSMAHFSPARIRERAHSPIRSSRSADRRRVARVAGVEDQVVLTEAAMSFSFIDMKAFANNPIAELRLDNGR